MKPDNKSQISYIEDLASCYGENITLGEILRRLHDTYGHYKCPKCNGIGYISIEYNGYPSGLPDSGFVYEAAYRDEKCDLCNGVGWTRIKYKPKMKMVQEGFEPDDEIPNTESTSDISGKILSSLPSMYLDEDLESDLTMIRRHI